MDDEAAILGRLHHRVDELHARRLLVRRRAALAPAGIHKDSEDQRLAGRGTKVRMFCAVLSSLSASSSLAGFATGAPFLSRTSSGTVTVIPLFGAGVGGADGVSGVVWAAIGRGNRQQSRAVRSMVMDRRMEGADGCTGAALESDNQTMQPAKQLFVHTPLLQQE